MTVEFEPVPVVGREGSQRPAALLDGLETWVRSEPLAELVAHFGGAVPKAPLRETLAYLDSFSDEWDYRAKAQAGASAPERNQAVAVDFDADTQQLVMAAVGALGLTTTNLPQLHSYDHVLVNGAMVRYSIWRMEYAKYLITNGLSTSSVAALTAYRDMARSPSNPDADEPALLARYGLPPVANESQLMEHLLRNAFDLPELAPLAGHEAGPDVRFDVRRTSKDNVLFDLVTAPSPASATRARTGDTMRFWAQEVTALREGQKVLSISSAIYGPFQHAAALVHLGLPFGVYVDTVAIDFSVIPPEPAPYVFSPAQYLQEVRSTIRSYGELAAAVQS